MTVVTANLILLLISSTEVVHFCKETKKMYATEYIKLNRFTSLVLSCWSIIIFPLLYLKDLNL